MTQLIDKKAKLLLIRDKIKQACQSAGRNPNEVLLVAVSKTKAVSEIMDFLQLGQKHFAENYIQEALPKIEQLAQQKPQWHFIGNLQSNKAKFLLHNFCLFHCLDKISLAQKIQNLAQEQNTKLDVLVQVNIDQEASKHGVLPTELFLFVKELNNFPNINVKGLMCIPAKDNPQAFANMRNLLEDLNKKQIYRQPLTELSMGMSADFEAAIAAGATIVRIGSQLFGEREK